MTMTIGGTSGLVFPDSSTQNTAATGFGFKNRIINGAMMIDQRNAGASVTAMSPGYVLDRFALVSGSGSFTTQQSTTAPTGFSNSMSVTVASAATRLATDYLFFYQSIEGYNTADFGMGSAGASNVTLSFWVRSSIAGLYSGVLASGANDRSYGFTYTITAANTWQNISVTVPGDTTGGTTQYPTGNTTGFRVKFDLGSGSNYQITAGSWQAATNKTGVAGTVSWAQTAGATFYITGVQLEKGSTATSFDYRPYGTELALCQRYFERSYDVGIATGTVDEITADWGLSSSDTSLFLTGNKFKVTKRSTPTMLFYNTATGASGSFVAGSTTMTVSSYSGGTVSCARLYATTGIGSVGVYSRWHWTASSEL